MFHKTIQRLLLTFGAGALLFGAIIGVSGLNRGNWVEAPATIVEVSTECRMEATERGLLSKTKYTKTIACEDEELFKAIHADKTWTTREYVLSTLSVGGSKPAEATLSVRRSDRPLPKRGEQIQVLQNPSAPERVAELGTPGREVRDASLTILVGVGLLGFYFWNRRRAGGFGQRQAAAEAGSSAPLQAPAERSGAQTRQPFSDAYPRRTGERLASGVPGAPQAFGRRR